ncbi:kinase [Microcystis phage MaMV-DC]|uniref:Serine/threonine protein kinase n=1 Tax=Microcystis phage MaMV-DC TaxID=1357715 RepID=A0A075BUR2_9CAUD|nr:kinase [Microcystis phage MaMV-DC]AGR48605.1 serine/threonine protein kinase [Microcystis phage MaMV-DC]
MAITMIEIPASQEIKSFRIGKYPVTQIQYQAIMGTNPSEFQNNPQNPVENVSWNDAQAFCQKLSKATGRQYRLPTEAEWEYACRAGTTTQFYFGDDASQLVDYAWYEGNSQKTTHPVGQKLPNAWGLYDMYGNVWEWCEDSCVRGGSWGADSDDCRSAFRNYTYRHDLRYVDIGFRVAETIRPTLLAQEMWEAQMPEPHKDMMLSEVIEYLDNLRTKEEKEKLLTAIYWSGFQTSLDHIEDYTDS